MFEQQNIWSLFVGRWLVIKLKTPCLVVLFMSNVDAINESILRAADEQGFTLSGTFVSSIRVVCCGGNTAGFVCLCDTDGISAIWTHGSNHRAALRVFVSRYLYLTHDVIIIQRNRTDEGDLCLVCHTVSAGIFPRCSVCDKDRATMKATIVDTCRWLMMSRAVDLPRDITTYIAQFMVESSARDPYV